MNNNQAVLEAGLRDYYEKHIKPELISVLRSVASQMVEIIDGNFKLPAGTDNYPVYTGNLHDATGVGVYVDGKVISFLPTEYANSPQMNLETNEENIVGREELEQAIDEASATFSTGIWIVIFSAVSYAYKVNMVGSPAQRGKGFFKRLRNSLASQVLSGLVPITELRSIGRPRKGGGVSN